MSSFTPVSVEAEDEVLAVSTYRSITGGQHYVHIASSDHHVSHYLSPAQARDLANSLLRAAASAAHDQVEEDARG